MTLADFMREIVHKYGGKEVAATLGTDKSVISRVLSGERGLSLEQMDAFLERYGYEIVESQERQDLMSALGTIAKLMVNTRSGKIRPRAGV